MYIDFKMLKRELSFLDVLAYFKIDTLRQRGNALVGSCPLHGGDNKTAFHINLTRNIYNCFTHCGGGNVLDFISSIACVDIYHAAKIGQKILEPVKCNGKDQELGFRLDLSPDHEYLRNRLINVKTATHFEIGLCTAGMMNQRIAIPIHDIDGNLKGYAGRSVSDQDPKYLFPLGFKKSHYLYNLHRVMKSKTNDIIFLVEGFFDVFRLHELGRKSLAIMGCSISDNQLKQLKRTNHFVYLLMDGDKAGKRWQTINSSKLKSANIQHRVLELPDGKQPENLDLELLSLLLK